MRIIDARDDRVLHVGGQVAADTGHRIADVVGVFFQIGIELEGNDRGRCAFTDNGLRMAHAAQACDRIFDDPSHLVLQFLRRGA